MEQSGDGFHNRSMGTKARLTVLASAGPYSITGTLRHPVLGRVCRRAAASVVRDDGDKHDENPLSERERR